MNNSSGVIKYSDKVFDYKHNGDDIIILGGSFNPIHSGHLAMAQSAYDMFSLPIIIMPNKTTYYKENDSHIQDSDRLDMIRLVVETEDYLKFTDMEITRGGVTHTIDTIRLLKSINPDRKIYFIIGGDSLEWIDKWVNAEELLSSLTILSAIRGNTDRKRSEDIIRRIKAELPASDIRLLDMPDIPVSSSDIRSRVASGDSISGMVTPEVEKYIYDHKLYIY